MRPLTRSIALASFLVGSAAHAQEALSTQAGMGLDYQGFSVARAGDMNGDGYDDVLVGAPRGMTTIGGRDGRVALYSGRFLATGAGGAKLFEWEGAPNGGATAARFAWSIAGGVDVDLDGKADILVGNSGLDVGGLDGGAVHLYSGATWQPLASFVDQTGRGLGNSVAFVGDVNGDGYQDIGAGAPAFNTTFNPSPGRARVWSGEWITRTAAGQAPATAQVLHELVGPCANCDFGQSIAPYTDLDGDGRDEFVVGAHSGGSANGGLAVVYHGATGAQLAVLEGTTSAQFFGESTACVGDVNGDGFDDLLVGAYGYEDVGSSINDNRGRVEVFSGEWLLRTWQGASPLSARVLWSRVGGDVGDGYGVMVASIDDLDFDGVRDVLVGAPQNRGVVAHGKGYVEVLSGAQGQLLYRRVGDALGDGLGHAVASVGDVDGDGREDFAAGAPWSTPAAPTTGFARVYRGLPATGTAICSSLTTPSSIGVPARMNAYGSTSLRAGVLFFVAEDLPPQRTTLIFAGPTQAVSVFGNGWRCIGGPYRRVATGPSDAFGRFTKRLPLSVLQPGTTLNVQAWYADPAGGGAQFNLSDARTVTFTP